ncbi:MAG: NAD(P)/FAD-dependent oxidoreductase [candidate division Zixibacteria bacterium]|nr:NAD(P)/FAD-dependent oxidoreductase [candidate division Zixibacteria bacterium]NIU14923.1 NAD(P)/FAD-dependent oxidoreductase [candidate division Zixibacteria bacterium]
MVGSGPAGATTARIAAERGLRVLLVDKKQELGAPIQCSGAVSAHALSDANISADEEFVSTPISGFAIYDGNGRSTVLDYRQLKADEYGKTPLGYVVDRRRFDRYLTTLAERARVEVWLKTEATGFEPDGNGLAQVYLKHFGKRLTVKASIVVGADGVQSQVGKWADIRTHIKLSELASCLQVVVNGVETDGLLEIITGHQWAPGGYAWIFPKGHGYAEVGLGIIRTMTDKDARWHLDHFIKNSFLADRLKDNRTLEFQGGGVPLAAPLKKQYADHIILVGDAARQVNPITGGGIHTALRCGLIAGNFLGDFIPTGQKPTADCLAEYQHRWQAELGHSMWELYRIKKNIFHQRIPQRDEMLYDTLAGYFSPTSNFRKI